MVTGSFKAGSSLWGERGAESSRTRNSLGSGQLQELLQSVLLHSLHEELIVLGKEQGATSELLQEAQNFFAGLTLAGVLQQHSPHPQSPGPYPTVLVPVDDLGWGGLGVACQGSHLIPQGVVLGDVH